MVHRELIKQPIRAKARWADTQKHAEKWSSIGASAFVIRCLLFGIWDPPTRPFTNGHVLPAIPQSKKDLEFGRKELKEGCKIGNYQAVSKEYAEEQVNKGCYISCAFVDWSKEKGRFIINLKQQSTHWDKRPIVMQSLSSFGSSLTRGDRMLSFDWEGGYRHFRLHSRMWDWFLFRYDGGYYRCVSLPFGWTRSPFWFCHLLTPLTRYMRSTLHCRVLQYIDDYLLVPGDGERLSTADDCL